MPTAKTSRDLTARPLGHNYLEELRDRFGSAPHLLEICDYLGTGEKRRPYELAEGIAIVNISGVLSNDPYWWDETGYDDIRDEVAQALTDEEVKGVLLRIDSPGGSTDGAFELAGFLAEAGKKKPMWSVADVSAYSAAYLIASQTAKIYAAPISGGLGSIGVYSMHVDLSEALKKNGVKITFISAGEGKVDGNPYEPLSKEALASIKAEVDRLYGEFLGAVSRGRKMSEDAIRKLGAHCYDGAKAAMGAGLADVAGSLEQAWVDMAASVAASTNSPGVPGQQSSAKAEQAAAPAVDQPTKEVPMGADNAAGNSAADKQYTKAELDQQIAEAVARARGENSNELAALKDEQEIRALCQMTGQSKLADGFVSAKKSVATVRAELSALAVAADAPDINGHPKPSAPNDNKAAFTGAMLTSAVDKLVAKQSQQMGGRK